MKDSAESNRAVFEEYPIPKALTTLAIPMIFGQLIVLVYSLADAFFIGCTNNPLMVAGISLILPVFNISISLAGLLGIGGGTLISRLLGAGRSEDAKKVSAFSFYTAVAVAAAFSAGMLLFMNPMLRLLGASDDTLIYARQYTFYVIVLGAIPTILSMTLANLLRSVGCARQAGFGISMGGILNVGLDPLFMFVLLPAGREVAGAAMATMLSNVVICAYFLFTLYRLGSASGLSLSPFVGLPERREIYSVFAVGVPAAVATFLFDLAYILIDKLMTGYGDIPLAAAGIVLKAERLPLNIGVGICQGMMPIAAYNYAAGNLARMDEIICFSRLSGLVIAVAGVLLYEIFAGRIMRLFIADDETVRVGTRFLRIRTLAAPFTFLSFHMVNLFQAVGSGGRSLFLAVARWAVFNIPLLFLLNMLLGMDGVMGAQVAADLLTAAVSFLVYYHFRMKGLKPREQMRV